MNTDPKPQQDEGKAVRFPRLTPLIESNQYEPSDVFNLEKTDPDGLPAIIQLGLDQLLHSLDRNVAAYQSTPETEPLLFLTNRVTYDVEAAIENLMRCRFAVVSDLMRDVMEIEYLIRDFWLDPQRIGEWLRASTSKLITKFGPGKLRKRYAHFKGVPPKDLSDTHDYQLHSENLHVAPNQRLHDLLGRARPTNPSFSTALCLAEIFEHSRRSIVAFNALGEKLVGADWTGVGEDSIDGLKIAAAVAKKGVAAFAFAEKQQAIRPSDQETRL